MFLKSAYEYVSHLLSNYSSERNKKQRMEKELEFYARLSQEAHETGWYGMRGKCTLFEVPLESDNYDQS